MRYIFVIFWRIRTNMNECLMVCSSERSLRAKTRLAVMLKPVKRWKTFLVGALHSSSPTDVLVLAIVDLPTEFSSPAPFRLGQMFWSCWHIWFDRRLSPSSLRLFEHTCRDPSWVGMSSLSCWDVLRSVCSGVKIVFCVRFRFTSPSR